LVVRSVVGNLRFLYVEVRQQNIVQGNVRMSTRTMVKKLRRLQKSVYAVVKHSMNILVMQTGEDIVLTNVCMKDILKQGCVHIAKNHSIFILRLSQSVVRWNVGVRDRKVKIGQLGRKFLDNVNNVARSFGKNLQMLKSLVGDIVPSAVDMMHIFFRWISLMVIVFMGVPIGRILGKKFWSVTISGAKFADLLVGLYIFITVRIEETVVLMKWITLLPCVTDVTDWSIGNKYNDLSGTKLNTIGGQSNGVFLCTCLPQSGGLC